MRSCRWRANRPTSTRHCSTTRSGRGRRACTARPTVSRFVLAHAALRLFLARCLDIAPHGGALRERRPRQAASGAGSSVAGVQPVPLGGSGHGRGRSRSIGRGGRRAVARHARRPEHRRDALLGGRASGTSVVAAGRAARRVLSLLDAQGGGDQGDWRRVGSRPRQLRRRPRPGLVVGTESVRRSSWERGRMVVASLTAPTGYEAAGAVAATGAAPVQWRVLHTQVRRDWNWIDAGDLPELRG